MPRQKDLKRIVRSRMLKTGESYTAARLHIVKRKEPPPDYAALAGMSDAAVKNATGHTWAEWVKILDAVHAADMSHPEIAKYVSSHGVGSWWRQSVTVGYERIRGLRERGQRRGGGWEAHKSRTFPVPVEQLYKAFSNPRLRAQWLPVKLKVRTSNPPKAMRVTWEDNTNVDIGFLAKGAAKSAVAIQHSKLADKSAAAAMKSWWAERLTALSELLA